MITLAIIMNPTTRRTTIRSYGSDTVFGIPFGITDISGIGIMVTTRPTIMVTTRHTIGATIVPIGEATIIPPEGITDPTFQRGS